MGEFDLYCERTDPGLWAEPLNAVTNIAFIFAAALAFRQAGPARGWPDGLLAGLILAIGLGSLAFHTMANRVGMLADVIPILAFQLSFLEVHATRILTLGVLRTGRCIWFCGADRGVVTAIGVLMARELFRAAMLCTVSCSVVRVRCRRSVARILSSLDAALADMSVHV
jgi:Alkaline phytoceramidase (aPHC).